MENGLEISSRSFKEFGNIHLMEFIDSDEKLILIGSDPNKTTQRVVIWDLYNTHEVKPISVKFNFATQDISTRLASTSGNLLQVDDKGKVQSILKMIDNNRTLQDDGEGKDASGRIELEEEVEENKNDSNLTSKESSVKKIKGYESGHTIYSYKDTVTFRQIIKEAEPWIKEDYQRTSFCLYKIDTESLQLIVGRSTVQIWHQFLSNTKDKNKEKKNLLNEGKPFLEYIWTNGIPVDQETDNNKLHIEKIRFGEKYFHLKAYWYEEDTKEKTEDKKKKIVRKERTIEWDDINENANGVRYACKALEHLNKRKNSLANHSKTHKVS